MRVESRPPENITETAECSSEKGMFEMRFWTEAVRRAQRVGRSGVVEGGEEVKRREEGERGEWWEVKVLEGVAVQSMTVVVLASSSKERKSEPEIPSTIILDEMSISPVGWLTCKHKLRFPYRSRCM